MPRTVTPCVGVWIEMAITSYAMNFTIVTPCVGVWIEMGEPPEDITRDESLPAWECGLKYTMNYQKYYPTSVTPCVGVWIEIEYSNVWEYVHKSSLPAWECGLKSQSEDGQ